MERLIIPFCRAAHNQPRGYNFLAEDFLHDHAQVL